MALRYGKNSDVLPFGVGEERAGVARAYRALPAAHREILAETFLRERTVDEAARRLGVPVDVVKSRVYQAMRALRVALDT
ncbi:sigma factor-like helix-turn-helix DNA-binding protein [Actinomadura parmotrematis]|uniref:sigma factor-like helix-turn-helix DNA-binding protein n=1 Tax=Actinomadura parmotrematis TaxID=2864039 RepID=UPI0027E2979A|nr:sigma factor-like helix-turn-helix DNA-binding protein [Actinomadura parmotrematis]